MDSYGKVTIAEQLDNLCNELSVSMDALSWVVNSSEYPDLVDSIKGKYEQRSDFLLTLREEYTILFRDFESSITRKPGNIYENFAAKIQKDKLLSEDVLGAVIDLETKLVAKYRSLLRSGNLSKNLAAILQAQAEKINADIEQLKLDLDTFRIADINGHVEKHKNSQIRMITD